MSATADGFSPPPNDGHLTVRLGSSEAQDGIDIVLQHGGARLTGLVADATGGPVPGATVHVLRFGAASTAIALQSGEDGRFGVFVPPGPLTVSAEAIGYAAARVASVAPSSDLVITLTPESSVEGTVVSGVDGKIVADVEIRAVASRGWASPSVPAGVSNSDGVFAIRGLQPNVYTLVAEGLGWRGKASAPVRVGLAGHVDHVSVVVARAATVRGNVVSVSDGVPCSEGSVSLGPSGPPSPYDAPMTPVPTALSTKRSAVPFLMSAIAVDGGVLFRGVPRGSYHAVVQCADHVLVDGPTTIDIGAQDVDSLVWKVDPGAGLTVQVVDETGTPLPAAQLRLLWPTRKEGQVQPNMVLTTNVDGLYEFPGVLYPGVYTLSPEGGYAGDPVQVEVRAGMRTARAVLHLSGQGSLLVRVLARSGEPVDDVRVSAWPESDGASSPNEKTLALQDSPWPASKRASPRSFSGVGLGNGEFRVGPLAAGRYRVLVADGVNPKANEAAAVAVSSRVVVHTEIVVDRGASIRGTVRDGAEQPAPDVWVSANCDQSDPTGAAEPYSFVDQLIDRVRSRGKRMVSDTDGRFVISHLASDATCAVRAEEPFGAVALKKGVHPGDDVVLTLPALGSLGGNALSADGRAASQFTLALREDTLGVVRNETVSTHEGHWTVTDLPPGHWELSATDEDGAFARTELELSAGQTVDSVTLTFASSAMAHRGPVGMGPGIPP